MPRMARTDPQINIRLPAELLERIRDSAEASGRSLTGEIAFRLYESFRLIPEDGRADYAVIMEQLSGRSLNDYAMPRPGSRKEVIEKLRTLRDSVGSLRTALFNIPAEQLESDEGVDGSISELQASMDQLENAVTHLTKRKISSGSIAEIAEQVEALKRAIAEMRPAR